MAQKFQKKEMKEISIANHRQIYRWKIVSGLDPKNIEGQ